MKNVIIFKNDRIGDLFVSIKTIEKILHKHNLDRIYFYFSHQNSKFSFLFSKINKITISMKLNIIERMRIFLFFLNNKIDSVYILKPKLFYFILAFIFRNTKFYGIVIKNNKGNRPPSFFQKYLYKKVFIDRTKLGKRKSSYDIQLSLLDDIKENTKITSSNLNLSNVFLLPDNYFFFHYKDNLFNKLLRWDLEKTNNFIIELSKLSENLVFSSEIFNSKINNFFLNKYITFDYVSKKIIKKNGIRPNIIFLKDIDGDQLFLAIKNAKKVIAPEGMASHMAYFLKKKQYALMHFNFNKKQDIIDQLISCKEWFPPENFNFIVLKKNLNTSIQKIKLRIKK
tara:strand:- start:1931 stop:2950 length:1020 start_codon:yes stop_codon:yes gene_type:complete